MCEENWSGRDEYISYDDCHTWLPFFTIMNIINLIHAICNTLFAMKRLAQAPCFLPKVLCTGAAMLTFCYGIRISFDWVLGDRNPMLNVLHGIGFGCYWLGSIRFVFNYLKTVLLTEKLRGKTEVFLPQAKILFRFLMALAFFSEVGIVVLPCFIMALKFFPTYIIFNLIRFTLLTGVFVYYGVIVRNMLNSMEISRTYYQKLRKRLDLVLFPWIALFVIGSILYSLALSIPLMTRNQYVVSAFTPVCFQITCSLILVVAKGKKRKPLPVSGVEAAQQETLTNNSGGEQQPSSKSEGKDGGTNSSTGSTPSTSTTNTVSVPYRSITQTPSHTYSPYYSPFATPRAQTPHTPLTPLQARHLLLNNSDPTMNTSSSSSLHISTSHYDIPFLEPLKLDPFQEGEEEEEKNEQKNEENYHEGRESATMIASFPGDKEGEQEQLQQPLQQPSQEQPSQEEEVTIGIIEQPQEKKKIINPVIRRLSFLRIQDSSSSPKNQKVELLGIKKVPEDKSVEDLMSLQTIEESPIKPSTPTTTTLIPSTFPTTTTENSSQPIEQILKPITDV